MNRTICFDQGEMDIYILFKFIHHASSFCRIFFSSSSSSRLHEVCLIENTERKKWYRAFCADSDCQQIGCNALMVLLDYDEVWNIPYNRIWKLPSTLAFPVLTIDCFIQGKAYVPLFE